MFVLGGSGGAKMSECVTLRLLEKGRGADLKALVTFAGLFTAPESVPEKYKHLYTANVENRDAKVVSWADVERVFRMPRLPPFGAFTDTRYSTLASITNGPIGHVPTQPKPCKVPAYGAADM